MLQQIELTVFKRTSTLHIIRKALSVALLIYATTAAVSTTCNMTILVPLSVPVPCWSVCYRSLVESLTRLVQSNCSDLLDPGRSSPTARPDATR